MSPVSIAVLAIGMSVDALIAALGRGASPIRPTLSQAVRTGLVFGVVEMLTPIIGWAMGVAASQYIQAIDQWVAFILLAAVGGRMTIHAMTRKDAVQQETNGPSAFGLLATAVGTSLDAMAVGVSLAFLNVNIIVIAAAIGLATMVMSTGGMLAGRYLGARFGRYAEIIGGVALIGLGAKILFDHLLAP